MKGLTFKNRLETIKVLIIYRYISLVVTSLFFLFGDITQSIYTKAFIITSISIAAIVLNYVYFSIWGEEFYLAKNSTQDGLMFTE